MSRSQEAAVRPESDLGTTRELVEEVLCTALALEDVIGGLLEEMPLEAFPGPEPGLVLLEMVIGSALPAVRDVSRRDCRAAIALIGAIRERVLDDLHAAAELANPRETA